MSKDERSNSNTDGREVLGPNVTRLFPRARPQPRTAEANTPDALAAGPRRPFTGRAPSDDDDPGPSAA